MDHNTIEIRKKELDNFVNESYSVIVDFANRLEINNPTELIMDFQKLENFIFGTVNSFISHLVIEPDDRLWIITRIGYLLGEYFKEKYSGYWLVNENPNSIQYGHYVVHALSSNKEKAFPIDVFGAAAEFIDQTPERNLDAFVKEIESVIK